MRVRPRIFEAERFPIAAALLFFAVLATVPLQSTYALIVGGTGNDPLPDPGWPSGAAAIFNHPSRVAHWGGFDGGQWHAECRGDATAFNAVLADFAKLDVKNKRLILHDGPGSSFWINPNHQLEKRRAARIDWRFMVWVPADWKHLQSQPADLNPTDRRNAELGPPVQIDAYIGDSLRWSNVIVPVGIEVVDERLEAHGFTPADGIVLEGNVVDAATNAPIAAKIQLERVPRNPSGGDQYEIVRQTSADRQGRWVLKNAPAGGHRIVAVADGYVPRIVGHVRSDGPPGWRAFNCGLSRPAPVSGQVADAAGHPLVDVSVRLVDVATSFDRRYESTEKYESITDADGRFRIQQVPAGTATIRPHKSGFTRPGLGQPITTPNDKISLNMIPSAGLRVTVDFQGIDRPADYLVDVEPEGGLAIGAWGGSSKLAENNQASFENVPPRRYVVQGHPNPTSDNERSEPVTVDLSGGKLLEVTLPAKAK